MDKLILGNSRLGKSVYATSPFKKGDKIIEFKGDIFTYYRLQRQAIESDHFLQIGENLFLGPSGGLDDFINHSCNPNSGIVAVNRKFTLFAIKDIGKMEEITFDYSTSTSQRSYTFKCGCESENCRGVVGAFQYLPAEAQERYINLGIIPPYIMDIMRREHHYLFSRNEEELNNLFLYKKFHYV